MSSRCRAIGLLTVLVCATNASIHAHDLPSGQTGLPPGLEEAAPPLLHLIPAGIDQSVHSGVKGVINRTRMWPQNMELTVCFLSGTRKARARVAAAATEWTNYVNLTFNFGDMTDPRTCSGSGAEHIKIDFIPLRRSSYVGIDSWRVIRSMSLDDFGYDELTVREEEFRGVVLHEFGHAIGLEHEHQSPAAKCDEEFDTQQLNAWAARVGWSAAKVKTNLERLQPAEALEFTRHDRNSVMHYSLPPEMFRGGKSNRCWIPKNNELSEGDKRFAASLYPLQLSSIDGGSLRLGQAPAGRRNAENAEADYRAELQKSYESMLAKAGLTGSAAETLAANFRNEIAKLRSGLEKAAK
jgi:hypothetical protein